MLSVWHLLLILIILVLVMGPSRLEGIGSSLGKAIRGFKKGLEGEEEDTKIITKSTPTPTEKEIKHS